MPGLPNRTLFPWTQNTSTKSAQRWQTCRPGRTNFGGIFDYDAKSERLRTVNASLEDPAVWNDPKKAQELGKEKKALDGVVVTITNLTSELADNLELFEMSKEEGDDDGLLTAEQFVGLVTPAPLVAAIGAERFDAVAERRDLGIRRANHRIPVAHLLGGPVGRGRATGGTCGYGRRRAGIVGAGQDAAGGAPDPVGGGAFCPYKIGHCLKGKKHMFGVRRLALAGACVAVVVLSACSSTSVNRAPVEDRSSSAGKSATVTDPRPQPVKQPPGFENAGKAGYYTVKPGDTLMRIGLETGQGHKDIARWNAMDNPDKIEVGQVFRMANGGFEGLQAEVIAIDGKHATILVEGWDVPLSVSKWAIAATLDATNEKR